MGDAVHLELFPKRSLGAKRLDYIYAGLLVIPLVLMAFQGDIVFSFAERFNYRGMYTEVHRGEAELQLVKAELKSLENQVAALDPAILIQRNKRNELYVRITTLRGREDDLTGEVKALRKPLDDRAAYWNLSFVRRWPLALLLGPFFGLLLWLSIPEDERRTLYSEALAGKARTRGLVIVLGSLVLFWVGAWQQNALDAGITLNQGTKGYAPPFVERYAYVLSYLSLAGWLAGATLVYTGRRGLRRLWLPMIVIMALLIVNYGSMSSRWAHIWDTDERWGYGYFVGPIAAMLLYYKLSENPRVAGGAPQLFLGRPPWRRRDTAGASAGDDMPAGLEPAWQRLLLGGAVLFVGIVAAWAAAIPLAVEAAILKFAYIPFVTGAALVALGVWQRIDRNRHAALAMRAAGLIILVMAVVFRWQAVESRIHYFVEISLVGVLLGGVLAVFGFRAFRVAWVGLAFIVLAMPWPERVYVTLAGIPQTWAAIMAQRLMGLVGYTVGREGNVLQVLPGPEGRLAVAEACSGMKILFAFVALSVVYAYISPRRPWRRVVAFASSIPIAVVANFTRVFAMALFTRWGYRGITEGMQHMMAGFIIMLPLAFFLLWLEMRVLDLIERVADVLAGEGPPADDSA